MTQSSPPTQRPKRFWTEATAVAVDGGYAVALDSRRVRTPRGQPLVLPTVGLAELIAVEWSAQGEQVEMASMHATRIAFTAADHGARARADLVAEVVRFAGSDLVCYFADGPGSLVETQKSRWGPLLYWAATELGLTFTRVHGIIHAPQSTATLDGVAALAGALDDYSLTGLAYGAALFGSAVIVIALQRGELNGEAAFDLARLDEAFQESQWGVDAEAAIRAAKMRAESLMLAGWFAAMR